jgi:hypothetical protein
MAAGGRQPSGTSVQVHIGLYHTRQQEYHCVWSIVWLLDWFSHAGDGLQRWRRRRHRHRCVPRSRPGFEPVSVKTQPVSRLAVPEFRILKIHRAETRLQILGVSHEISDIPR